MQEAENIVIIHHDDADGLCSAALAILASAKSENNVKLVALEKLFPQALDSISRLPADLYVFVDIGAAHLDWLKKFFESKPLVVIDHHDISGTPPSTAILVHPEEYGYSGERDASASTMVYLVLRESDPKNAQSYAHLAVIGSAEIPGPMRGLNQEPLRDAINGGKARIKRGRYGVYYEVVLNGRRMPHYRASAILSTLGSIGYYRDGPRLGVMACLKGFDENIERKVTELEAEKKILYEEALIIAKTSSRTLENVIWFDVGDLLFNVGSKSIGLILSRLRNTLWKDENRYLVASMHMNPEIPGLGRLNEDLSKFSVRVPISLEKMIEARKAPPAWKVAVEAAERLGGFADGHDYAASGVVRRGLEEKLAEEMDEIVRVYR